MTAWHLNRIKIKGFKAFTEFEGSYNSDIIVYDGPNGFGKTSLFDAKQVLFTGALPRIKAKVSAIKWGQSKPEQSLYHHHGYQGDVIILAEFVAGEKTLTVIRKALETEQYSKRKPEDLSHFKLYQVADFDNPTNENEIRDEARFWESHFGENFLKSYSVLHYLPQDYSPLLIPDESVEKDKRTRTSQIEHLFNADEIIKRIGQSDKLQKAVKDKQGTVSEKHKALTEELGVLPALLEDGSDSVEYQSLVSGEKTPEWDKKSPFATPNDEDYQRVNKQLDWLDSLTQNTLEVKKRIDNKKKKAFVKKENFQLAVALGNHLHKFEALQTKRTELNKLNPQKEAASKPIDEIYETHITLLKAALPEQEQAIAERFKQRAQLLIEQSTIGKKINDLISARNKLTGLLDDAQSDCPLCGFDYDEKEALLAAINTRTDDLQKRLNDQGQRLSDCNQNIQSILDQIRKLTQEQITLQEEKYDETLLSALELHKDKTKKLQKIVERLKVNNIELPTEYVSDQAAQDAQVLAVKTALLEQLEPEGDSLSEDAMMHFNTYFETSENLTKISRENVQNKKRYVQFQYNSLLSKTRQEKQKLLERFSKELTAYGILTEDLKKVGKALNTAKNQYINQTVGQIESLFHIYSGRLLQNYQCGLGVFINMPSQGEQAVTKMNFFAPRLKLHDATLSMSSGQSSALSLALFLALNKRYAEAKFVFIDDPTQCMDEINIASLSDLLRVELRDKQVVLSTHEQEISSYLTYRYEKAGLKHKTINLLKRTQELSSTDAA